MPKPDPSAAAALQIQRENRQLRRRLEGFFDQARENEEKMRRFNELELRLIGATAPEELLRLVVDDYRAAFHLDAITLLLFDPEYEMTRLLEQAGLEAAALPGLILISERRALTTLYGTRPRPQLRRYDPALHRPLFPAPSPPRSIAALPLIRRGELIGSLNLGSGDAHRFNATSATDFLERLAAVTAICLENCANHQRLTWIGLTDPLTRVNNRRFFDQRIAEEAADAIRHRHPLTCLLLDIDHFKGINDTLGHQAGDWVLRETASLIDGQLRRGDTLARYGGEEFAALLPDTDRDDAVRIAERIRSEVEAHLFRVTEQRTIHATISIGIAVILPEREQRCEALAHTLVKRADEALYRAKNRGRNRVEYLGRGGTGNPDLTPL